MLWNAYRLRKNWQFQQIIQKGSRIVRGTFSVRFLPISLLKKGNLNINCLFGIAVPKNIVKKAVKRNHYKGQIRMMLIKHIKQFQDACGTGKQHRHLAFVIMTRCSFLERNFLDNQTRLFEILFHIYNKATL